MKKFVLIALCVLMLIGTVSAENYGITWEGGGAPCGACRELMVQLMPNGKYKDIEIMMDYATGRVVRLGDITPEWWIS